MSALNEYYAALERLKANKPTVLPKGSAINNDTVALEAGRKRGSIKKSRYAALIEAIEQAAQTAGQNVPSPTQQIEQAKSKTKAVKSDYEQLKEDYGKLLEIVDLLRKSKPPQSKFHEISKLKPFFRF
jgi:predicted transcriptional regulator